MLKYNKNDVLHYLSFVHTYICNIIRQTKSYKTHIIIKEHAA